MLAQTVRINLRYDRADLKQILRYANAHDVERNGRYDFWIPPSLNIWTHTWSNAGCKAEACVMFSLEFDWKTASLMSVMLSWATTGKAFSTNWRGRMAALGNAVHGKSRCKPTV